MSTVSAPQLLESVVEVTREKDRDELRASLIQTIEELLPTDFVGFCPLAPPGAPELLVPHVHGRAAEPPSVAVQLQFCRAHRLEQLLAGQPFTARASDGAALLHVEPIRVRSREPEALAVQLRTQEADDVRIVTALSRLYANFLDLIHESERDRLTSLYNRRAFDSHLNRLVERLRVGDAPPARPSQVPGSRWWLALVDVDHFKRINDTFGHLYGDEVLLLLARLLEQSFRGEDLCFRYGGEEFAVVLSRSDATGAAIALERLRTRVASHVFPQIGPVTISIGYTGIDGAEGPAELLDRADKALYHAKNSGRNRIAHFETLVDSGALAGARRTGDIELF